MNQQAPLIWKILVALPIFISGFIFAVVSWFSTNYAQTEAKLVHIIYLFSAEFIMLFSAAVFLIFIFRKQDQAALKYWAILDVLVFITAGFIGASQLF
jgi:hypothetical protein